MASIVQFEWTGRHGPSVRPGLLAMLDTSHTIVALAGPFSSFPAGACAHRRALECAAAGRPDLGLAWAQHALAAYRREMAIEPIARLRVHELMMRVRQDGTESGESSELLEIVQRLNRLDRLESLAAPHELRDAREVLAQWIEYGVVAAPPAAALESQPVPHWPRPDRFTLGPASLYCVAAIRCSAIVHSRKGAMTVDSVSARRIERTGEVLQRVRDEVGRAVVGQRAMVDRLLIGLLTGGHVLLEGVPGLAKTLAVSSLAAGARAAVSGASSSRPTCCPPTSPGR